MKVPLMIEQDSPTIDSATGSEGNSSLGTPRHSGDYGMLDVLTQLAFRKWLIAKVTGIATIAGLAIALLLPIRYTATTKILPPQQTQSTAAMMMNQLVGSTAGPLSAMAGGGLSLKNPNDTYVGLLMSRPIGDAIIQKFNLTAAFHARDMTAARKKLAQYTKVTSDKNGFIVISVTDKDRSRVAKLANAYTDQLRILTNSLAVTEASQRRLFYEEQLKQVRAALLAAELAFLEVQQKKGLVQLDAQAKAMIESITVLRAQIAAKQVELEALRSYSTDSNPDVQLTEKELTSLQAQAAQLEQHNHSSGFTGIGLEDVPTAGIEYLRAEHELGYQHALFDMLMKQYDAARLDEAKNAAIIQIVEPAIEPEHKSSPNRASITLGIGIAAFCLVCLFIRISMILEHQAPERQEQLRTFKKLLFQS